MDTSVAKPLVSFVCVLFFGKYDDHLPYVCQLGDKQWTQISFYTDIVRVLAMKGEEPLKEDKNRFCSLPILAKALNVSE